METLEPVSYEFAGQRRVMASHLGHHLTFYANPAASFPMQFQSPSAAAYHFGQAINPQHAGAYQHYFMASQQPITPQPVRLSSEPPPFQSVPEIRPARNVVHRGMRDSVGKPEQSINVQQHHQQTPAQPWPTSTPKRGSTSSEAEFSTEVDVLMKAIQAKDPSQDMDSHPLSSLQHLNHEPHGLPAAYSISPTGSSHCSLMTENQLSRSGKKRKYTCTTPNCGKSFAQKTHLDIHTRAHTGDKPFVSTTCLGL